MTPIAEGKLGKVAVASTQAVHTAALKHGEGGPYFIQTGFDEYFVHVTPSAEVAKPI